MKKYTLKQSYLRLQKGKTRKALCSKGLSRFWKCKQEKIFTKWRWSHEQNGLFRAVQESIGAAEWNMRCQERCANWIDGSAQRDNLLSAVVWTGISEWKRTAFCYPAWPEHEQHYKVQAWQGGESWWQPWKSMKRLRHILRRCAWNRTNICVVSWNGAGCISFEGVEWNWARIAKLWIMAVSTAHPPTERARTYLTEID